MTPIHQLHLSDFYLPGITPKPRAASKRSALPQEPTLPTSLPSDGKMEAAECVSGRAVVATEGHYSMELDIEQMEADSAWRAKQRRYRAWHEQAFGCEPE